MDFKLKKKPFGDGYSRKSNNRSEVNDLMMSFSVTGNKIMSSEMNTMK
jgi:hypothetical protein